MNGRKLVAAAEGYFTDLARIRASGGATGERSSYVPLTNLLNAVGAMLKPRVFCVGELANQGAGHPDLGLYAASQVRGQRPRRGQLPERGVVEVKSSCEDTRTDRVRDQVGRYHSRYGLVLVTNLREFSLVASDAAGRTTTLESFTLAPSDEAFNRLLADPRTFARRVGTAFGEYLARMLSHRAAITSPSDLAWLLASYARDGLARVEAASDVSSLVAVRSALEEALGVRFKGDRGTRFFCSSLVQTLFYGVFSAWVLWSRQRPGAAIFDWRVAVWHLRNPVLRALFQQLSDPGRLDRLRLVEVLDWTSAALARVDHVAFFKRFRKGEAVQYFYEPFLEAFDPGLRKQLGVWYTPAEVVRYMVARVDRALKDDLGIADGLASDQVYVLDPCCGTGAFIAEVLRRIAINLEDKGIGALVGAEVRKAASERVFGFEIMPAPLVVAHLQVGLTLQERDRTSSSEAAVANEVPPRSREVQRPGIFLTNALTGWEPHVSKPLPFPELEEERDKAGRVKRNAPILVVLGNPPYNGFAGVAVEEERALSDAYRNTQRVRKPQGQGLNDLYVRFFRMAERRIARRTGRGVVCFISNYSWLDGLSFTGMRERYTEAFDTIRIDCLNGDKYKTGKTTPDGDPDPSVFSTPGDPVGIQVGTAIATLIRKSDHESCRTVEFRHLWGQAKLQELTASADTDPEKLYHEMKPVLSLGLPFVELAVSDSWSDWPSLTQLFRCHFPGVTTGRDAFLVDIDLGRLKERIGAYFDKDASHDEVASRWPHAMRSTRYTDARVTRDALLARGGPREEGFVRYAYRPFDTRWLYWEADTKLLDRKRSDYRPHVFDGNLWLSSAQHLRRQAAAPQACFTGRIASAHLIERGASMFPAWLRADHGVSGSSEAVKITNLSDAALRYCRQSGITTADLFHYCLAVLHDTDYRRANAGALQLQWPRIPLPDWPDGAGEASKSALSSTIDRGRKVADLLNDEVALSQKTSASGLPWNKIIATPSKMNGSTMTDCDFEVTAGWGRHGVGTVVMPGPGRANERRYTPDEHVALCTHIGVLGDTTFDIYLNDYAYWRNVPASVWSYKLGGYQVLKKWLSYREQAVLERPLRPAEVLHFTDTARRIAMLLLDDTNWVA